MLKKEELTSPLDVIIVGASYPGLLCHNWIKEHSNGSLNMLVLEAEQQSECRLNPLFHLSPPEFVPALDLKEEKSFQSLYAYTNKNWEEISEAHNPFSESPLSVESDFTPPQKLWSSKELFSNDTLSTAVSFKEPVQNINWNNGIWELKTAGRSLQSRCLIWTSSLVAFQNCIGKPQSQKYLKENPHFEENMQAHKGGVIFDFSYKNEVKFEKLENSASSLLMLPVKHSGKVHLCWAYSYSQKELEKSPETFRVFSYLHEDLLRSHKDISSFQKSVKRVLRQHLQEEFHYPLREKYILCKKMRGSYKGLRNLLSHAPNEKLFVLTEDSYAASESKKTGLEALEYSFRSFKTEFSKTVTLNNGCETTPQT